MKKKDIEDELVELHRKYDDLVWYARADPSSAPKSAKAAVMSKLKRIREQHPVECGKLVGPSSAWTHGFHSGVLAGLRIAIGLLDNRPSMNELARSSFPDLDT